MLVLTRLRDQAIMIGDDVEVRIIDIRGEKVRVGVIAPREVSVHRKEIYEVIRRENQAAATVTPADIPPASAFVPPAPPTNLAHPIQPPPQMRLVKDDPDAPQPDAMYETALAQANLSASENGVPIGAV